VACREHSIDIAFDCQVEGLRLAHIGLHVSTRTPRKAEKCMACSHKLYKKDDGSYAYTPPPACVASWPGKALNLVLLSTPYTGPVGSLPEGFADPKHSNPPINFVK